MAMVEQTWRVMKHWKVMKQRVSFNFIMLYEECNLYLSMYMYSKLYFS